MLKNVADCCSFAASFAQSLPPEKCKSSNGCNGHKAPMASHDKLPRSRLVIESVPVFLESEALAERT